MSETTTGGQPNQGSAGVETRPAPQPAPGSAPPAGARCLYCGSFMVHEVWPRFSRGFGIVVLIMGVLLSVFMSILLGLPVVVFGAYLWIASRNVWACRECGAVVDRA